MLESPEEHGRLTPEGERYPADRLGRFRWHTGATLRPLERDERCPILFRDVGPEAMGRFLEGGLPRLRRLAGPLTPITYLRTADYREPYLDHGAIGRLIFLRPLALQPWRSGVPSVYVADARRLPPAEAIGFVPSSVDLVRAAELCQGVARVEELREALGGRSHDAAAADTLARIADLGATLSRTEARAEPLRRKLQSGSPAEREWALREMERRGIGEEDLCAAWHHLPERRRAYLIEAWSEPLGV